MNDQPSFLPFSAPSIGQQEIDAVTAVLRSGWITTGARASELESAYCRLTGCQHAIALYSATAGMHLALHALNFKPGDEVITPSLTWVSTVNMIVAMGATPVFVDVDRDSLMTTAERIEPLISDRTRLIIPVHYAGAALDLDSLRKLSQARGIGLLEDAAHAIGTEYKTTPVGASGTAIFSMHPIKNITTGEGGMFCTDDAPLAERIRRLKFHGLGVDAFDRETHGRAPQAEVIEPGFKYNLPDMNAALGIVQIERLGEFIRKRTLLAEKYLELLSGVDEISPLAQPDFENRHAWHLFIVRLDIEASGITREAFMARLKEMGIGSGLHFRAAHLQKYFRENLEPGPDPLTNTEWNSERILSLPLFPDMQPDDVDRVVAAIKSILAGRKS
jgi:UDP-4-amino-4-deoxy-L-arabinose-oxoglutarate aminotransferase